MLSPLRLIVVAGTDVSTKLSAELGYRSWRYSMVVANSVIEKFFCEPGINDEGTDDDPYTVTAPEVMIEYFRSRK